jgi:hypothetical protein
MLALVWVPVIPLHAQSAPTPGTQAVAADSVTSIPCSTSDDPVPEAQAPPADQGQARLVVRGGLVSLEARACTLTQLLSLISARTGIRLTVSEAIPPSRLSLRTPAQSIEATIRELLHETDVFVLYAADPPAAPRLAAVWVYPRGSTRDIEPVPAEQWASTRELQGQLTERNPDLRARAIEALIARGGEAALPQLLDALADDSAETRERALDAALAASLDVPLSNLQALALNDPSPEVRLRALQALEERPDSTWVIEAATHDPDSNIRHEAQSVLRRVTRTP